MLRSLVDLELSGNNLTGSIPSSIGNLENLITLYLYDNQLSGSIPQEVGMLSSLVDLELSGNKLTGSIPSSIGNLGSLTTLYLHDNHLSGNIPPEFGKLSSLQILDLAANDLSGSIPGALEECMKLFNLNLSNNRLGESIPAEIGRIHNLQNLDLGYNLLIGKIPQQIGELQRLETLNLSHNELSGLIPSSFDNMLNLTSVDVSFNQLDGAIPKLKAFQEAPFDALRGCGTVYRANFTSGQLVAVKKLHVSPDGDLANLKGFTSEIYALTNILHHNIVKLHGYCSHQRHSFLVYEFLEGRSLGKILSSEDHVLYFDWIKRVNVVKDVANALSYMHHDCSPAIIHRDISNKNVLLDLQTFGYAAHELAYTMEVNERCDVYSFGVLTMEVIMGKQPGDLIFFLSSSSSSSSSTSTAHGILLKDVLDQRLPTPENQVAEQVVVVAKLAFACLHANPPSRPTMRQVAMKLSDDLRSHLQNEFHMITLGQLISTAQPLEYLPSILGLPIFFDFLHSNISIVLGDGFRCSFWNDSWIDAGCFKLAFPRLYMLSQDKEASVFDIFSRRFSSSGWVLNFRRNPYSWESVDLSALVHVLNSVPELRPGVEDKLVWNFGASRVYSVKSAYEWLSSINSSGLVVPRVLVFWTPVVPLCSTFVIHVLKMSVMSFFIARNEIKFAGSDVNWLVSWLLLSISLFAAALCYYIVVCLLLLSIVVVAALCWLAAALCCLAAVAIAAVLIYYYVFAVLPCFGLSAGWFLTN
ncbi:hypothetical protein ACSBR1_004212 [Camellia fascicularis]